MGGEATSVTLLASPSPFPLPKHKPNFVKWMISIFVFANNTVPSAKCPPFLNQLFTHDKGWKRFLFNYKIFYQQ